MALLCSACAGIQPAAAAPIAVSAQLTLHFLTGRHETGDGGETLTLVPLPLGEIDARFRTTTLHLEGLPGISFGYGDGAGGTQYTRLSIVNISVREAVGAGFFAGVGQTVYNQSTDYARHFNSDVATQSSRVTGLRVEAGFAHRLRGRTRIEVSLAANPAMRGVQLATLFPPFTLFRSAVPERAVQIDASLHAATRLGRGDIVYGVRYINYASRYDVANRHVNGMLADRNVGIMPLAGYRITL